MNKTQRWKCVGEGEWMERDGRGDFVLYYDHDVVVAAKDAEIERLKEQNKVVSDDLQSLCRELNEVIDEHGLVVETTYADAFRQAIKESPNA